MDLAMPLAVDWDSILSIEFLIQIMAIAGVYAVLTMGLQINVGYTGIDNFGQAGFAAMGAYVMAVLVTGGPDGDGLLSFWIAMPIAIIVTMLFGLLVGSVSLRLRADYFAIATIAAAEAVRIFAQNADSITGGNQPLFGYDSSFEAITEGIEDFLESAFGWDTPLYTGFVIVIWTTLFLSAFVLTRMQRTPWGRVLRAVREDEDAARALGKNSFCVQDPVAAWSARSSAPWAAASSPCTSA